MANYKLFDIADTHFSSRLAESIKNREKCENVQILYCEDVHTLVVLAVNIGKDGSANIHAILNMQTMYRYNVLEHVDRVEIAIPSGVPGVLLHYSKHATILDAAIYVNGHNPVFDESKLSIFLLN